MPAGGLGAVGPQTPDLGRDFRIGGQSSAASKFPAGWSVWRRSAAGLVRWKEIMKGGGGGRRALRPFLGSAPDGIGKAASKGKKWPGSGLTPAPRPMFEPIRPFSPSPAAFSYSAIGNARVPA